MKSFHVVTGLPRSGSTLLCNILNQNPEFYASSTSSLPAMCGLLSHHWSNAPEVNSMLIRNKEGTEKRFTGSLRALAHAWYDAYGPVVFDKSRGWSANALMLQQLFPEAVMLVMVRDPRSVFGSIEKQHQKSPVLDHAHSQHQKSLISRADQMFGPDGMVGGPIFAVEDLVRRRPGNVLVVQYEKFAEDPGAAMETIYKTIDQAPFQHDFDNVVNVSEDVDELYLGKFEHRGEGKVEQVDPEEWKKYVSTDIGDLIMKRYPFFNKAFGYG